MRKEDYGPPFAKHWASVTEVNFTSSEEKPTDHPGPTAWGREDSNLCVSKGWAAIVHSIMDKWLSLAELHSFRILASSTIAD